MKKVLAVLSVTAALALSGFANIFPSQELEHAARFEADSLGEFITMHAEVVQDCGFVRNNALVAKGECKANLDALYGMNPQYWWFSGLQWRFPNFPAYGG